MQGLYLVTPNWDDTANLIDYTRAGLEAGAAMVQYRHKEAGAPLRCEQATALLALCRQYARPLIINDHIELCMTLGADGVHVGGTDVSVREARAVLGPDKIVGASCYGDLALAAAAERDGASYAAFGGFYPSPVKRYSFTTSPDILTQARAALSIPLVVIGGMTPHNAAPLVARGADMVAAITSVYQAHDPGAVVRAFGALFAELAERAGNA
ncbi:thiamine phosphate synthase [Massilia sp. PAMC28688]|uniref:thiamine phosphate synthase n=1 Tax=Massilia sp. PAMC28688 TaxID=2861283 RepID=UPI001C624EDA|nr:thiamine phosphate synthase [Massilia sp. PAMC28688]QYF94481.1 thiamine phosphate synthase [Massilia sp. PAMC28688]